MLLMFAMLIVLFGFTEPAAGDPLKLILPTSNHALLEGDGPSFYQYTDRNFNGVKSRPWQGGRYGFVRNPKETSAGIVYTRFHEGVDIKPVYRDYDEEPLDTVRAVDDGYVVYTNHAAGASAYGKYVVVEHWWSGSPFYSLYAHLNSISVREGQRVRQGHRLGRLGYTGTGINKRRAHLHFEINLLLNSSFEKWHADHYRSENRHELFHGVNLAGLNVADLYLALAREPNLTIDEFLSRQETFFVLAVANNGALDLTERYPWLIDNRQLWNFDGNPPSWEISFTESGLPIRIEPSGRVVAEATVTKVRRSNVAYTYLTGGLVSGSFDSFSLGNSGRRYVSLLTMTDGVRQAARPEALPVMQADSTPEETGERVRSW